MYMYTIVHGKDLYYIILFCIYSGRGGDFLFSQYFQRLFETLGYVRVEKKRKKENTFAMILLCN